MKEAQSESGEPESRKKPSKDSTELSEKELEGLAGGWADPKPGTGGGGGRT